MARWCLLEVEDKHARVVVEIPRARWDEAVARFGGRDAALTELRVGWLHASLYPLEPDPPWLKESEADHADDDDPDGP